MASFDFSTLGSTDLEELVCDLLNAALPADIQIRYKTFKEGKDKGIDFVYGSGAPPYERVGQVKHYYRTGFTGLLYQLQQSELPKVKKLQPQQYILATSVDLSESETAQIMAVFTPYIKSIHDIYGKKDLNRLLDEHEEVLTRHYKLWFSSAAVLKKLLTADLFYRSADFEENELKRRISLHVKTPVFAQAFQCLESNSFVVITGEPGVGKTTLAEMLVYYYLKEDYQLLFIHDDIKDVEKFLQPDDSKQVIYFDDFLGSNAAEIQKAQGSEAALISIVRRLRKMTNKRLIFTTRTHILNIVIDQSGKLKDSHLPHGQTVFNLTAYNVDMKVQMLINHVEQSALNPSLKALLMQEMIMSFIVNHPNFNPRSIEFITTQEIFEGFSANTYHSFILRHFDDPSRIWSHAYKNQIGYTERILLNTLLMFDGGAELDLLENAFNFRIITEDLAQVTDINPFKTAFARLANGFIVVNREKVNFINPSLVDYLVRELSQASVETKRMINTIRYIYQLENPIWLSTDHKTLLSETTRRQILTNFSSYLRPNKKDEDAVRLAIIAYYWFMPLEIDELLPDILHRIRSWKSIFKEYRLTKEFLDILDHEKEKEKIQAALRFREEDIVGDLFWNEHDVFVAVYRLEQLHDIFNIDFSNYDHKALIGHLDPLFDSQITNDVDYLVDHIYDENQATETEQKIVSLVYKLHNLEIDYEPDLSAFNRDWQEIANENEFRRQMEKDD